MGALQNHVKGQIEEYLGGELDLRALDQFEGHLQQCRSCASLLREAREAQACMESLKPVEAPPAPGPDFYYRVERSIRQRSEAGWLANLAWMFHGPRVAFPLLFLFLGLLLTAWTISREAEWSENGVLDIPPARFTASLSAEAGRDLVMVSLVDEEQ